MNECNVPNCNCKQPRKPVRDLSAGWQRRKADQAWEMAGLARMDGDQADEAKWTAIARERERAIE